MSVLAFRDDGDWAPLLAHAEEVMQRADAVAQRVGIRNRGRDIRLGEKNCFRHAAPMCEVAGKRGRKGTTGSVSRFRALAGRLENLFFNTSGGSKTQEIGRLFALIDVASGDHHI